MKSHHTSSLHLSLAFILLIPCFYVELLPLEASASGNETDLLALLKFKELITRDPHQIFDSWNDSLHFCNWYGITCSRKHQRVASIVLEGQNLFGSISPFIGNLSFLRLINLRNNSLHGEIPQGVGNLFRLRCLLLGNNTLHGEIPVNLTRCSQLQIIGLGWNNITGELPMELGSLSKLEELRLSTNKLIGKIPASLGNLSLLTSFFVTENCLEGNIPNEMGRLTRLGRFGIGDNGISGMIPPSLFNISSIKVFSVAANQLNGILPNNIGATLPNVQTFAIGLNQFHGPVPNTFSNASQLQTLDIYVNNFMGAVPTDLGNLQSLWWLGLARNNLGSKSSNDLKFLKSLTNCSRLEILDFGYNNFGGVLPNSVANLSIHLLHIFFGGNEITGTIPTGFGNLINLYVFAMESNFFTGAIPSSFGKLNKLQLLSLSENTLSGHIPSFIGNLTQLSILNLSHNQFDGVIPSDIQNCQTLNILDVSANFLKGVVPSEIFGISSLSVYVNLSQNSFIGKLPAEVGHLKSVNSLDFSYNNLSGEIPSSIGDCSGLEFLYLQGNSFQGSIPSSLSSLKGLQHLDLSRNNLTGELPQTLQNLTFLQYLNLSFNNLEGELPAGGIFRKPSSIFLIGNGKLCGGVPDLHLSRCPTRAKNSSKSHAFMLKIIVVCLLLFVISILALIIFFFIRKSKKRQSSVISKRDFPENISYMELYKATNGFSVANLIGYGSFSSVYQGFLDKEERMIAVKVLNLQQEGASRSIMAECNVLRNIRHRNLVKVITYCSSLDKKGNEFKALVLEFMSNGSLEKWLHPVINDESQPRSLNFLQRLNIAIDVASALHYLHNLCEIPIVHCDLKPSNILLDENLVAHVSDFGLARLLPNATESSQNKSSTVGIKGTIGYAAPEYAMGCKVSKERDMYSYGILLIEMFSGKKPTDEMFKEVLNLHDFVKMALAQRRVMQIVDPTLMSREIDEAKAAVEGEKCKEIDEETNNIDNFIWARPNAEKCLVSILEIGVYCSTESPKERMKIGDVERKLHLVRKAFLCTMVHGGKHI